MLLESRALHHYPQFIFEDGEKLLWNPIVKKVFKNRPEERIRLKVIEFLLHDLGWSSSKISTETPIKLPTDKGKSRTDIICYDTSFKPYILAECKAESISINEQTAQQIARYNSELQTPFLLLTNGLYDFWFDVSGSEITPLSDFPHNHHEKAPDLYSGLKYWQSRGFIGKQLDASLKSWTIEHCKSLYVDGVNGQNVIFQEFDAAPAELFLPGYYRLAMAEDNSTYPICFSSTPTGATHIHVASDGHGILSILLQEKVSDTFVVLCTQSGIQNISHYIDIGSFFNQPLVDHLPYINELIRNYG